MSQTDFFRIFYNYLYVYFYRTLQEVHLDKKIRLIDSPGVALCSKDSYDRSEMALKNAIRVDLLDDPVTPVEAILRKCTRDYVS